MFMISSCSLFEEEINPEETIAAEGNFWQGSATGLPNAKATVMTNDKGIANITINYNGKDTFIKGRVSKKKIEDFVYSNGDESKSFKLVDFDDNVGAKWEYAVGTQKVVREVTHKSTTDDTFVPGLYLMIKVSEVVETIPDGIVVQGYPSQAKQIVWQFNHKFGWISSAVTKTDNSVVYLGLSNTNVGTGGK